jgi:hypothetical protein
VARPKEKEGEDVFEWKKINHSIMYKPEDPILEHSLSKVFGENSPPQ